MATFMKYFTTMGEREKIFIYTFKSEIYKFITILGEEKWFILYILVYLK